MLLYLETTSHKGDAGESISKFLKIGNRFHETG